MIKVGIVGGTGYTGVELMRLLAMHPRVKIEVITSQIYFRIYEGILISVSASPI